MLTPPQAITEKLLPGNAEAIDRPGSFRRKTSRGSRILAATLGGLGDAVLFTPVIGALRRRYPEAELHALASRPLVRTVLEALPQVDRVFLVHTNRSRQWSKGLFLLPFILRSPKTGGYDLGAYATGLNPWLPRLLKLGGVRRALTAPVPPVFRTDLECNTALARRIDPSAGEEDVLFPLPPAARREAQRALQSHGLHREPSLVAVYPSTELPHRRRWPLENLAVVMEGLKRAGFQGKVVVVGSREEGLQWQKVDTKKVADANLAGKLSILGAGALLSRCRLAVCNDGGLMHVAGAVGCPLVALMPDTPLSYRPAGRDTVVLAAGKGIHRPGPSQRATIMPGDALSVEEVFSACRNLLEICLQKSSEHDRAPIEQEHSSQVDFQETAREPLDGLDT